MKRELLALGLTVTVVFSLVAFAQPSAAVIATVSGPDEVQKHDRMTFSTAVEIREDERIPIEHFELVVTTEDGESVTVTFAPNGSVLDVDPATGVVGDGEIRIDQLERSIEITPLSTGADHGYGYLSGEDERTGEQHAFGYGYGYGYGEGDGEFAYEITLDSRAFKHGEYTISLRVDTGADATFESNENEFEVLLPSGGQPGDRGATDRGGVPAAISDMLRASGIERGGPARP